MYTCDGEEVSPPLAWSADRRSKPPTSLIMDDPDANGFVHWVVVNLPPDDEQHGRRRVRIDARRAIEGASAPGDLGYIGPCPPSGEHGYVFTLYALSEALAVGAQPSELTADTVRGLIEGFVIDEAELTGTYSR